MGFEGGSLYEFLGRKCSISLNSSRNTIEVIFAGEDESRLLNLPRGSVLLQILSVSYDQAGTPVEHARVISPGFKVRFNYESFKLNGAKSNGSHLIG